MDTPICDFVKNYASLETLRLHMPGHKGESILGMEALDITEIDGADSLYEADGVIATSEKNASKLFGCHTFYSTEGSSQCIRAMLYLAQQYAGSASSRPVVLAGRNAHKTFHSAAALLDLDVRWIYPTEDESYLSCSISALDQAIAACEKLPIAVYLTSPDYLGNMVDIRESARICHKYGILLLVDNAHGAYLRFLPESLHPCNLGADMCCSSAHKTLPVLTGGAYLHISSDTLAHKAKKALSLFGSTSPSYLILQSLDAVNRYLSTYKEKLAGFLPKISGLKNRLMTHGYKLCGDEQLKITIMPKTYGYTGCELSAALQAHGIICEFADPDFLVLMLTPDITNVQLERLEQTLCSIPTGKPLSDQPPATQTAERVLSIRDAVFADWEIVSAEDSLGRILATASVGCPPAVPILACGERIDKCSIDAMHYYGISSCCVVKD